MLTLILKELKHHVPFTLFGTILGIGFMIIFSNISQAHSYQLFYTMHPVHIVFSAITTASMFGLYKCGHLKEKCQLWQLILISMLGAIGTATMSDSIIPYIAEMIMHLPHSHMHIGFLEEPWLTFPPAIIGIALAYFRPSTKFPHFSHVLLSTWASLFHFLMAANGGLSVTNYWITGLFLFFAVWLPCCFSDIVFPLLFVHPKDRSQIPNCH